VSDCIAECEPGLGDPGEDEEDQELLNVIRSLPPDDPLPDHLADHARRKSLVQMEVSIAELSSTVLRRAACGLR
jgi:hypothetical protein